MSVMQAEDPEDRRDEDVQIAELTQKAVEDLVAGRVPSPLEPSKFIGRLLCGHEVSGTTRAVTIRVGSHGQFCEACKDFQLFEDVVLARPLVDSRGKR